jgi:hypothetical protein
MVAFLLLLCASLFADDAVTSPFTNRFSVDLQNRAAVRNFFNSVYFSGTGRRSDWNGNVTNCDAGATSAAFQEAVLTRINFFRAMAGVPAEISFDPVYSAKAQQAALVVSANLSISHEPTPAFSCYTDDGAEAANASNLALGTSGIDSIEAYMLDAGPNYRVGHRRWLLYPQTQFMGNGDIDPPDGSTARRANANWVIDENFWAPRPETRDGFVAWPPPGFVPHKIIYPRWSFSFPQADFTNATVSVTANGVALPIHIEKLEVGYGENTIVFVPGGISPETRTTMPKPAEDLTFAVAISGVKIGGVATNFNYSVTVFDPDAAPAPTGAPSLSGPPEPEMGRSNRFLITAITNASGYDFRVGTLIPLRRIDPVLPDVTPNISALYPLVQTNIFASSNAAFHLAHTTPARPQTFALNRYIVPSDRSELRFQSRLGASSTGQVARVQVSLDDGSSWREIYSQPGQERASEQAFAMRRIPLSDFAGRVIQIRFEYGFRFGELIYAPGTGDQIGWYIDDISITSAEELIVESQATASEPEFPFVPDSQKNYYVDARPRFFDAFKGEWTAGKIVAAVPPPPAPAQVRIVGLRASPQGLELEFEPTNTRPSAVYRLETAEDAGAPWLVVNPSTVEEIPLGARRAFRLSPGSGTARLFRVTIE